MAEILPDVCADYEVKLSEFNGEGDHVQLLVHFPPNISLAEPLNCLKGASSRRLRQEFPAVAQHYRRAQKLWSPSYCAGSSRGAPPETVKKYIENHNRPTR